ncbi:MAG: tRNA pseudouridine(55) synthase TruB [Deltaproteobacteria bacterium HGW-Deltaproteobacteria-11]|nr:MAG: tRNA pseudouridine(55) synthase TruB [Deltaproteobacteria bacterium HGW-Deltaproteobacteria-11]
MNGFVVIDKPAGMTSHDVVAGIRRLLGIRKVGHTGTLDPLATGVLLVGINEATKLIPFFDSHRKDYLATMHLGVETDTLDRQGRIIAQQTPSVTPDEVAAVLKTFVGEITQIPPRYSAVKFQGRPLYAWARKGIDIDIEPLSRTVEIYSMTVDRIDLPDVVFRVSCSRGTYVRSICADAGKKLGCGACLTELRRMADGPFMEKSALQLNGLLPERQRQMIEAGLIRLTDTLPGLPAITVDATLMARLKTGGQPTADNLRGHDIPFLAGGDMVKFITAGRDLVAVARTLYASQEMPTMTEKTRIFEILRVFNEV